MGHSCDNFGPKTSPGYDPAYASLDSTPEPGFTDALYAAHCSEEFLYEPVWGLDVSSFAFVFCPTPPAITNPPLHSTYACDACTGAAPAGWTIVMWAYELRQEHPDTLPFPGPGCQSVDCLNLTQDPGEISMPIPPAFPPALKP
jgi:hypothetical protein